MYVCSVCQQRIEGDVVQYRDHTDKHIVELIKHDHPDWSEKDGLCPKCYAYYKAEINGSVFKDAPCALRIRKVNKFITAIKGIFKR